MRRGNAPTAGWADDNRLLARMPIYAAVLATLLVYWAGLAGPFILDDAYNLAPIRRWLDGQASWSEVIFGNSAGILGRPVSMASFLTTAAIGGFSPYHFKFGNLVIHIACGLLAWQWLKRLLPRDPCLARHARVAACIIATLWLLHPLNASTVLYSVQRMAQLSTFFVLLALLVYVHGRVHLDANRTKPGWTWLFIVFPTALLAGIFSKENAAVAPALCLVIEFAYFRRDQAGVRTVAAFFGLMLVLPALLALGLLALDPDRLLGLYATRDFTLLERLLSQARALVEYVGMLLAPRGGQMGVFFDDFQPSAGLFVPSSTFIAILGLTATSAAAWWVRHRAPSVFAGWFFFLIAHGVESSFLPLELYFEHRNYLPGIGLILAVAGLWALLPEHWREDWPARRFAITASLLAAATLAGITLSQARTWRSMEGLMAQTIAHRPTSLRANLELATLGIRTQRFDLSVTAIERLKASPLPRNRALAHLNPVTVDCYRGAGGKKHDLTLAVTGFAPPVTLAEVHAFRAIATVLAEKRCGAQITSAIAADAALSILATARSQPAGSKPMWLLRATTAELLMRANRNEEAVRQAVLAWQPEADPAIGALLARIYLINGELESAEQTVEEVATRIGPDEIAAQRSLARLRTAIVEQRASSGGT